MNEMHTIILADGTELSNLVLNGNNYITTEEVIEEMFEDNLYAVTIDGVEHENMRLIQIQKYGNEYWFILADRTAEEAETERQYAINEYLAMKLGVDLDEVIG